MPCVRRYPQKPEEGVEFPGAGVTGAVNQLMWALVLGIELEN